MVLLLNELFGHSRCLIVARTSWGATHTAVVELVELQPLVKTFKLVILFKAHGWCDLPPVVSPILSYKLKKLLLLSWRPVLFDGIATAITALGFIWAIFSQLLVYGGALIALEIRWPCNWLLILWLVSTCHLHDRLPEVLLELPLVLWVIEEVKETVMLLLW